MVLVFKLTMNKMPIAPAPSIGMCDYESNSNVEIKDLMTH